MPSDDNDLALRHAQALLTLLGAEGEARPSAFHPALGWRRAGLMAVTGRGEGPGLVAPVALASAADGALAALRVLAPDRSVPDDGALLLAERARLLGLMRQGRISANGSCRLLMAQDGLFALNLAREEDWDLIPALLGAAAADWAAIERIASQQSLVKIVAQGRLLGLPIAPSLSLSASPAPFTIERMAAPHRRTGTPLVVDLSSLWAGPLAGSLLAAAGAQVVKVESTRRPDGARGGDAAFFDLMNGGKLSIALDFHDPADIARLHALLAAADIVIEASRPRALEQLGIDAREIARGGATWLSITAHGRDGEAASFVGFGDDTAVAGGLVAAMERGWGEPLFAGDAIADPLTGITAALTGWASWLRGGGCLVSVPLSQVVAHACALYEASPAELRDWQALAEADDAPLTPLRAPRARARALGADNAMLSRLIGA